MKKRWREEKIIKIAVEIQDEIRIINPKTVIECHKILEEFSKTVRLLHKGSKSKQWRRRRKYNVGRTPKYNVGRIIIHSDQEEETEKEDEWLNQFQVAPPPKSPNYTSYNETKDEQASIATSSDENETAERRTQTTCWHKRLNLNIINQTITISGETLQTFGLKNIKTKVQTIETGKMDFKSTSCSQQKPPFGSQNVLEQYPYQNDL